MEISDLPTDESDEFEFKSSQTQFTELKKKLSQAVSAFANSGGGFFIAGVDDGGSPDGGFPSQFGTTQLTDWIDQVIHEVQPAPQYSVELLTDSRGRGTIDADQNVIAVHVPESLKGPHQAFDRKYYIRAGAHTVPARHFIVESIWARRHQSNPRLIHLTNIKPFAVKLDYLIIDIIAVTDAPAIDVEIDLQPQPPEDETLDLPLKVPLIDRSHNFTFEFRIRGNSKFDLFG